MQTDEFYIPNSQLGIKTASFLESATLETRCNLFKLAADDGNLAKAYTKLQKIEQVDEFEDGEDEDEEKSEDEFGGFQLREDSEATDDDSEASDDDSEASDD
jgi:hypothetical protein